jgi:hypothetical protein
MIAFQSAEIFVHSAGCASNTVIASAAKQSIFPKPGR